MQPSTQLCLYIHTEGTHVYMRVWIYKIHRNCMEDTRMWAVKKQRKYHHRPYGIRDARIIPVHTYIIPNQKNNRHHMCCSNCPLRSTYSMRSITFSSQLGSTVATIRRGNTDNHFICKGIAPTPKKKTLIEMSYSM